MNNTMKKVPGTILAGAILAVILFLAGCSNILSPAPDADLSPAGTPGSLVRVQVALFLGNGEGTGSPVPLNQAARSAQGARASAAARTIYPDFPADDTAAGKLFTGGLRYYVQTANEDDTINNDGTYQTAEAGVLTLELGLRYQITVYAYKGDLGVFNSTDCVANGVSAIFEANASTPPVLLTLAPVIDSGYSGAYTYSISYPAGVTAQVYFSYGGNNPYTPLDNGTASTTDGVTTYAPTTPQSVSVGFYLFTVRLTKGDETAGRSEIVWIARNLNTHIGGDDWDFRDEDFTQPLTADPVFASAAQPHSGAAQYTFTLSSYVDWTNTVNYPDGTVWKVYAAATGDTLATGVTAKHPSIYSSPFNLNGADTNDDGTPDTPIPGETYWVSATRPGYVESARTKLTIQVAAAGLDTTLAGLIDAAILDATHTGNYTDPLEITLTGYDISNIANWQILLPVIADKGKYLNLNLSGCTGDSIPGAGGLSVSGKGNITGITLPTTVTSLAARAFYSFSEFPAIDLSHITSLGNEALAYTNKLATITINRADPTAFTSIAANAFAGHTTQTITLLVPSASVAAYRAHPVWGNFNVTAIGSDPGLGGLVTLSGTAMTGQPLTAAATLSGSGNITFKWYRDTTSGTPLRTNTDSAESDSYTLADADATHTIVVVVSRADLSGTVQSAPSAVVTDTVQLGTTNTYWKLTGTGDDLTLVISGYGPMPATGMSGDAAPWSSSKSKIRSLTIANGITSIGPDAFNQNHNIHNAIVIPDSVTSIGDGAFSYSDYLPGITLGAGVVTIGIEAFYGAPLTTIDLPASVTSIGANAFGGSAFTSFTVAPGSPFEVTTYGFVIKTATGDIIAILPSAIDAAGVLDLRAASNLTAIPASAFANNTTLTKVLLPASITSIGNYAFMNAGSLTTVSAPGVTSVGSNAFSYTGITAITQGTNAADGEAQFPALRNVGGQAFVLMQQLLTVSLPAVETLPPYGQFIDNSAMTSVNLSGLVSYSGQHFMNCTALTDLYLGDTPPTSTSDSSGNFYLNLFDLVSGYSDHSNITIHVPTGSLDAYVDKGWPGAGGTPVTITSGTSNHIDVTFTLADDAP